MGPVSNNLTTEQLARQLRKIEKDKRKKQYEDLQVQGTNNSSIVSKRSVEKLYETQLHPEEKQWFASFVAKKVVRRSPAINRGYWIRMESIKVLVKKIVDMNPNVPIINIVNLGCGFDPLPFQLYHYSDRLRFIDVDYPELINNKYGMIYKSQDIVELLGLTGTEDEKLSSNDKAKGIRINHNRYTLIGCDLKNAELYESQLNYLVGSGNDSVTIFIAEVSLAYMRNEYANKVIEISSRINHSHFVILEQILPDGHNHAFAQKMIAHFNKLRSSLHCIEDYPTKAAQVARFKQYYNGEVEIHNLFENWHQLIDDSTKSKIHDIEEFDEWEEFIVFCQHYIILHATTMAGQTLYITNKNKNVLNSQPEIDGTVSISIESELSHDERLQWKFPGAALIGEDIVIQGGLKQTRTNGTMILHQDHIEEIESNEEQDKFPARMAHSLTSIGDKCVLVGGRARPGKNFNDIHLFEDGVWNSAGMLAHGRSRHSTVKIDDDHLLIFGGLEPESETEIESFIVYEVSTSTIIPVQVQGMSIGNMKSSAIAYNGKYGIIVGGMNSVEQPIVNGSIYQFEISRDVQQYHYNLSVTHIDHHAYLFSRIGCKVKFITDSKVIIIGGVSPYEIYNDSNSTIITYDISTKTVQGVCINESIRTNKAPLLIGFEAVQDEKNRIITIVGGGAVCYSFGSEYNGVYTIRY
ncbi:carboxymethyltransferase [Scheffersomyces amazonensis]|uniref:carboxymethyltransferase n=1 Tax=Scheffersomyces amazonensis TaxID=1078765 RepID=UPI00315D3DCA